MSSSSVMEQIPTTVPQTLRMPLVTINTTHQAILVGQSNKRPDKVNFSMTNDQRRQLCLYADEHPEANQRQLIEWFRGRFNVAPSQAAISRCLKRRSDILQSCERDPNLKRLKKVTFPLMEDALSKWYTEYKGLVPIDGNVLKQQGSYFLRVRMLLESIAPTS
ncbi:hypothetical protein POJ06DRAFT_136264 [Lipomyces tetrasporus]|uniref:ARS-binding protein 1 N-terminal domain-containing protein n=1 Tax=Lipomyces tetrasporus TaxID=54092 RepID=A0AAD7QQA2_9ASCO|nr:uncharacterized protein POJ06DRAFT_136264 [Lipomyces tetrasporus]KAJ8099499.1 hypothetical protein POJ06DRAFT_136264 [Lipomyces tetrasporus]